MRRPTIKNIVALAGVFLLVWLSLRWLLPLLLPFLLGTALALAAEPLVRLLCHRLGFPRPLGAGIGISLTLILLVSLLVLLTAAVLRELATLANALPDLEQTATQGLSALEGFLTGLVQRMPEGVRPLLNQSVSGLFSSGSALLERLAAQLPALASSAFSHVPGSALTLGTGILSGFMISARLPRIRAFIRREPAARRLKQWLPVIRRLKTSLWGWLKAQLTISGLSFVILAAGLLILGVSYAPVWALCIALVDAVPVLGTGAVLLPWALVGFLQGKKILAVGLLGIYVVTVLSRSVLEPRLVGRQLGIDPLLTLMALYIGYRIWGIGGMLLSPLLCTAAVELAQTTP